MANAKNYIFILTIIAVVTGIVWQNLPIVLFRGILYIYDFLCNKLTVKHVHFPVLTFY